GVMVEHHHLNHYNNWLKTHIAYAESSFIDCSSKLSFDATVSVLFTPLVSGQTVALCPDATKENPHLYLDYLEKHAITLIKLTPTYLSALLNKYELLDLSQKLKHLKCLIVGGEKAHQEILLKWMKRVPHCQIIHHYGPTETT
ncbi:AMP-binding protein, partial [Legionella oakridgensis]|uniref:AMP-binding protein n=1 Tax=Legionella oakridgensis TaxID=29423 RepID=UPI0012DCFEB2